MKVIKPGLIATTLTRVRDRVISESAGRYCEYLLAAQGCLALSPLKQK
jgi:hypothetical protein